MTLKYGMTGAAVRALRLLLELPSGDSFDSATKRAVKAFQKGHGLEADGIAGIRTLTALCGTLPDLALGDTGTAVRALQALVGASTDGIFGKNTRANVVAFQLSAGLETNGCVDADTWRALWDCGTAIAAVRREPVDYKQYDARWRRVMYSSKKDKSQTIGSSGCGPTAMADICAAWVDARLTPIELAAYATANGYRTADSGTAWGFFRAVAAHYSYAFGAFVQTSSMATLRSALNSGAFAVASMGKGYWTRRGHFICVYKMDEDFVYAKDPASSVRKKQRISAFEDQRKQFFIYFPKEEDAKNVGESR